MAAPNKFQVFLAATGAVVPPAVLQGGLPDLDLRGFPPDTEHLRLSIGRGHLEGAFVPAETGAPVVLHLLASQASITYGTAGLAGFPILWQLRDLGLSSLIVDYRGVGASPGSRSPRHLPEDAWRAWEEAVQRAGDVQRVVIRGMSLGSLAAATLLERGARPAGVILVAPVRAETVVRNWANHYYPPYLARLSTGLVRPSLAVDAIEVFRRCTSPLLVYAPRNDYLLPGPEQELLQEAVAAAGGKWIPSRFGHPANVLNGQQLIGEERLFHRQLFSELPPARDRLRAALQGVPPEQREPFAEGGPYRDYLEKLCSWYRMDPPHLACALAQVGALHEAEKPILRWLRMLPTERLQGCPLEPLAALLELDDPAGRLRTEDLEQMAEYLHELAGEREKPWEARELLQLAGELRLHDSVLNLPLVQARPGGWATTQPGTPAPLLLRRVQRLLLKAAGIPERLRDGALEYWVDGDWQAVPAGGPAAA